MVLKRTACEEASPDVKADAFHSVVAGEGALRVRVHQEPHWVFLCAYDVRIELAGRVLQPFCDTLLVMTTEAHVLSMAITLQVLDIRGEDYRHAHLMFA